MNNIAEVLKSSIEQKEKQLTNAGDLKRRIAIIKDIAYYYSFTEPKKAEIYLQQLRDLAEATGDNLTLAYYHSYCSFLENQAYKYNWAIAHLKKAKSLFEEEGYNEQLGDILIELAGTYFNLKMPSESDVWLERATSVVSSHPSPFVEARLMNRKASLYSRQYLYHKSIDLLLEARNIFESNQRQKRLEDYHSLSQIYSNLGYTYTQVDDKENSVKAYLKAIEICEAFGFGMRLAWYYLHIGNAYSAMRKYNLAGHHFRKALTEAPQDSSQYAKAGASANLGQLYAMQGSYESALQMYNYAEKIYSQTEGLDDEHNFSVLERYRAQLHSELGRREKALEHYNTALSYAINNDDYKQMSAIYKDLAVFYEEQENFPRAYQFLTKYSESREKFINEERTRSFSELEVKYETEKKEREAEFLRLQTTELQLKALRAQMNPHFIFNSLNSIQGYISGGNHEQATTFFAKFSRLIRNSLEFSEFEVIPLEEEIKFLRDYLELEKERFRGDFDYAIRIDDDVEEDIMGIPPMIMQPYIENSVKHGVRDVKSGFVDISIRMESDDILLCIIEDNGVGRAVAAERQQDYQAQTHRSMGATITKQRLDLFNQSSRVQISSQIIDLEDMDGKPKGTRVEIRIPFMDIDRKYLEHYRGQHV